MFTVIYSDQFLNHDTGSYHPEKPGRLTAIVETLKTAEFADQLNWKLPTAITERPDLISLISEIHNPNYIKQVENMSLNGGDFIDGDTPISSQTYNIALLAVSAWLDGVDEILNRGKSSFIIARPPGHHAVKNTGMGFCIFSNAAIAAHYALKQPGINKVAILDWDVHHGNGTEAIVESKEQIIYCSLHQYPCYPGTGKASYKGTYNNVLNIPMDHSSSIIEYKPAFRDKVVPFIQKFAPDLLIVSAGYDANAADPLAGINLQPEDFGLFTEYCLQITPKIMFGLEGGYDFNALAKSVKWTIEKVINNG